MSSHSKLRLEALYRSISFKAMASSKAPWKQILVDSLDNSIKKDKSSVYYQLATLSESTFPSVRTVVHRGFVSERRPSENHEWSTNPLNTLSDILVTTTDIRSPKSIEIQKNPAFEICWWIAPVNQQFRLRGHAYIFGKDSNQDSLSHLKVNGVDQFNWQQERRRHFIKIDPQLRASFQRPPPGTPKESSTLTWRPTIDQFDPTSTPHHQKIDDQALWSDLQLSYDRFALVILDIQHVDFVQLGDPHSESRTFYSRNRDGSWSTTQVIP